MTYILRLPKHGLEIGTEIQWVPQLHDSPHDRNGASRGARGPGGLFVYIFEMVTFLSSIRSRGVSPSTGTFWNLSTTSIPSTTFPKAVYS